MAWCRADLLIKEHMIRSNETILILSAIKQLHTSLGELTAMVAKMSEKLDELDSEYEYSLSSESSETTDSTLSVQSAPAHI